MTEFLMDFGLRDWLLILGPVFIAGILIHGYWRMRSNRSSLKMALDKSFLSESGNGDSNDDFSMLRAELPNGGARVLDKPEQTSLNLDEDVPVLMDSVESSDREPSAYKEPSVYKEPSAYKEPSVDEQPRENVDTSIEPKPVYAETEEKPLTASRDEALEVNDAGDEGLVAVAPISATPSERRDNTIRPAIERPEKFVVIHVIAANEPFSGQRLLECLVERNMSHGEMNIFHRMNDHGVSIFSLANAVEPGVFDLANMDSLATPGVSMFLRVHELNEPVVAFDEMIAVAGYLAEELGGSVKDETRSVMTSQTFEYSRSEIVKYQHQYQNKNQ
jgi:cell division protein ZipA